MLNKIGFILLFIILQASVNLSAQNFKLKDLSFEKGDNLTSYDVRFELGNSNILPESYIYLDSIVNFLIQNPKVALEIQQHSDSRGSNLYSSKPTQRRAEAIFNYLVSKGIDSNRIVPKGYGEGAPCRIYEISNETGDTSLVSLTEEYINGFKTSDPEKFHQRHQLNRRVVFSILATDYAAQTENTQTLNIRFLDSIQGNFTNFSVDNFGNIYTTNKDVIVKFSPELDTLFSASLKSFVPTSIESSKSFRVLIFDKERGVISFLDNTLSDVNGDIDLADLDVLQTVLVCESFNGNTFWVLDEGAQQLLKVNQNLEVVSRVENLNFLFEKNESPNQMFEHNDELVIHFPGHGIATFDVFGTFLKFRPLKATWVNIKDNYLFALNGDTIMVYHLGLLETYAKISLPSDTHSLFQIVNQKLYVKVKLGLHIYSIKDTMNNKSK